MANPKILVVDDEPGVLFLVSKALSRRGYEVHVASDPLQALELAKGDSSFDLLVSDIVLPGMFGSELPRRVTERSPTTAVVLMSGHVPADELPEAASFISKPFLVRDLYSVVDKTLAGSERAVCQAAPAVRGACMFGARDTPSFLSLLS
jgi:DNA-binding NtrC family response regulator